MSWFWHGTKQVKFTLDINCNWCSNCKKVKPFCDVSSLIISICSVQLVLKLSNQSIWINSFFKFAFLCFFKFRILLQVRFRNLILYYSGLSYSKQFWTPKRFEVLCWVFKSWLWGLWMVLLSLKCRVNYLIRVILCGSFHRSCKRFFRLKHQCFSLLFWHWNVCKIWLLKHCSTNRFLGKRKSKWLF